MDTMLSAKAEALLNAHIAFILKQLQGDNLEAALVAEVDLLLENAPLLTLNDCVTPAMIKETVHGYAVELELGAGVLDIIGDVARSVYHHNIHEETTINDILPDHHVGDILEKVLEMKNLHKFVVQELVANPVYSALVSDLLYHGLRGYLFQNSSQKYSSKARSVVKNLLSNVPMGVEEAIEFNLRRYIQQRIQGLLAESQRFLLAIDQDKLRDALLDIWDDIKTKKTSVAREFLTNLDIEEFFVLGYEFWRDFRETAYFTAILNAGIDAFFNRYGEITLDELLEEVGIKREMLIADALRFVPPVLHVLQEKNLLEPTIRRHLEPFYLSGAVEAILST